MRKVTEVKTVSGYQVWLRFDDGEEGVVDLADLTGKGIFSQWSTPGSFQNVHIGSGGELCWDEEIDLCPDALYLRLTGKAPEDVFPKLKGPVHA